MLNEHISQALIHTAFQAVSGSFPLFLVEEEGSDRGCLCWVCKSCMVMQVSHVTDDLSNTGKAILAQWEKKYCLFSQP